MRNISRLTPEEERDLVLRWRDDRDEAARNRIVSAHLDLVRGVLSRLKRLDISREDLFQDGVIGLMKAVDRFDPDEGVRFSTYATYWVRAEIQTAIGSGAGPVRVPRSHEATKVATWFHRVKARVESDIALGLCGPPLDGVERETARRMGIPPDQISSLLGLSTAKGIAIRSQLGEIEEGDEGVLLYSNITPEAALGEKEYQSVIVQAIRDVCATLPERDREVIERRYLQEDPETFQVIADDFGLTRERVRQIEARALKHIHRKLFRNRSIRELVIEGPGSGSSS